MKRLLKRILRPAQAVVRRLNPNFIGAHGCVQAGASFIAWNQVEGDYLEFGVFRGESFSVAFNSIEANRETISHAMRGSAELARWLAMPPRYFAFDSFEGLPEGDAEGQADFLPGLYACSEREFRSNIKGAGVDLNRVVTIAGMYDQSLTSSLKDKHQLRCVSMVMIDCDLYESTVPVLDFITDLVGQGTIIIFHDWFRFKGNPNAGEQRACREWLVCNPQLELIEYWREGPQAVSFLVNLK